MSNMSIYPSSPVVYDPKTVPAYDPFEEEKVEIPLSPVYEPEPMDVIYPTVVDHVYDPKTTPEYDPFEEEKKEPVVKPKAFRKAMCKSYVYQKKCVRGDKCTFAHSPDELVLENCRFKERCNKIFWKGNVACNKNNDVNCNRLHVGETRENFYHRVGIVTDGKCNDFPSTGLGVQVPKPVHFLKENEASSTMKITKSTNTTTLEVSKELAFSSIKMLIDSGVTKIDLRIV